MSDEFDPRDHRVTIDTIVFALAFSIIIGLAVYVLTRPSTVPEIAAKICEPYGGVNIIQHDMSGFTCNNGDVHYVWEIDGE